MTALEPASSGVATEQIREEELGRIDPLTRFLRWLLRRRAAPLSKLAAEPRGRRKIS